MTILNNQNKLDTTLLIVADDLTGAGDTGVEFCGISEVMVTGSQDLSGACCSPEDHRDHKIISVNTATRNLPGHEAEERILALKSWIQENRPGVVFKKIDSCLRGAPGLEIKWLMDGKKSRALVVSALPNHGRTVEDGILKLNGVPLSESQMRHDPLSPMTESRPDVILAQQSGRPTCHLKLAQIRKGADVLEERVRDAFDRGNDIVSLDAVSNDDLDIIARVALALYDDTMICASSGLAAAIGRVVGKPCVASTPHTPHLRGLYICGSASSGQKAQIEALKAGGSACERVFGGENPPFDPAKDAHIFRLPFIDERKMDARTACHELCRDALTHITATDYGFIFVAGGDTADAFFTAVGADHFYLCGMLFPGIPWGVVKSGILEKKAIITKSGTFGAENTLMAIHHRLTKEN